LIEIFNAFCLAPSSLRHDELMDKKSLWDRKPDNEVMQSCAFREIYKKVDKGEGLSNNVPFPYRHGISIKPAFPMHNKLNFITAGTEFLYSTSRDIADIPDTRDKLFKIGSQALATMGRVNSQVDIHSSQHILDMVKFFINGHNPASNKGRLFEETCTT